MKVALYYHCKTENGWKRFPAALNKLNKPRPHYAQVGDQQIQYPEGQYQIRVNINGKRDWKSVGKDATEAYNAQQNAMNKSGAVAAAEAAGLTIVVEEGRVHLVTKMKEYLTRQKTRGKKRHHNILKTQLPLFLASVKVTYADEITEAMMLRWYEQLQEKGNSDYTIRNKHINVAGFLKWCGVATKPLAPSGLPSYVKKKVQTYTRQELEIFFNSLKNSYHHLVFSTYLKTGIREREGMFLEWSNFDLEQGLLTIRWKPEHGFDIKDREERTIPVSDELVEALQAWRMAHPNSRFVLGNSKDKPNGELLPMLKRLARNAGLNCGTCATCLAENQKKWTKEKGGCKGWTIKKFRSTYITTMLRNGVDPRTLMEFTGHESLETILLYLAPAEAPEVKAKVNQIRWTEAPNVIPFAKTA